ncbi:MAG TPA: hypothetical protein VOA78_00140 [Candidatus Dormibacteraeota bacterium]|nr:hypothetical protein [Candidatus Dormibacteraeota bacterium]
MKRAILLLCIATIAFGAALAAYRPFASEQPPLCRYAPAGALLYLEAKDFSSLLSAWNSSREKHQWVTSVNYQIFSRSRLFLRLGGASDQFAAAAGLPPDMNFLSQVAGSQSALALYDIGNLQFLYITKLSSANAMQTALWQSRARFGTREVAGVTFYLRRDAESEKEVAFAVKDDFLLLATREDLMAGALLLMAGGKDQAIEAEPWFSRSVSSAGPAGDLRMVLNLEKLVPSPYFRSYWIQQNITDMKQYSAALSDLFLSGKEYREERLLLKKSAPAAEAVASDANAGAAAVSDLARLVPADAGVFQVRASPSPESALALLETKLLAPHLGPAVASQFAPQVALTSGETGSTADLETRIDIPPVQTQTSSSTTDSLKNLLRSNPPQATLQLQSTELDKDGVFVRIHSAVALLAASDWNELAARSALVDFVRPSLTASQLGVGWQPKSGFQQLDGLWSFAVAVRGKYLIVSDDPNLVAAILARLNQKAGAQLALFIAGFNHGRERERFTRFTSQLDAQSAGPSANTFGQSQNTPLFFSRNIASFSSTLAAVSSQKIVVRDAGDKILQTVTYQWTP